MIPKEIEKFVIDHVNGPNNYEIADMVNETFDLEKPFTRQQVVYIKNKHGLKNQTPKHGVKSWDVLYPDLYKFVASNVKGKTNDDLAKMANEKFGTDFDDQRMKRYKKLHDLHSGLPGRFVKGNIPWTKGKKGLKIPGTEKGHFKKGHKLSKKYKIGTIIEVPSIGYKIIKIADEGSSTWENWQLLHRYVWEKHNGPIPEGMRVTFLDGDHNNCNIENLALCSPTESLMLSTNGWRFDDPELTKTGLAIVKLMEAQRKRKKDGKNHKTTDSTK